MLTGFSLVPPVTDHTTDHLASRQLHHLQAVAFLGDPPGFEPGDLPITKFRFGLYAIDYAVDRLLIPSDISARWALIKPDSEPKSTVRPFTYKERSTPSRCNTTLHISYASILPAIQIFCHLAERKSIWAGPEQDPLECLALQWSTRRSMC